MAIDFTTAAEAQAQQNNAGANTETAPITQEYMLTQINNSIKVRVAGGSSYADFNFSIFKSGKYTDLLLYYAGLVEETNKKQPKPVTKEEDKYTGISTNNPMDGKTHNWWHENISEYLRTNGYRWTFLYYRDQELPFGFRVTWSPDESNSETNPIWSAQNKEFPYVILPENRFILQKAANVEVAETLPAGQEATSDRLKNFFTIINSKIANAAQLGNNAVLIPWTAFGPSLDTQLAIIQLNSNVTVPSGDSSAAVVDPGAIHDLFNYGNLDDEKKVYTSAAYRIYNINEIKESKSGVAPIVFFTTSNANSEYYLFNPDPTSDADHNGITDFTLQTLLTAGGYNSTVLYADVDSNGDPYCAGIAIGWSTGAAESAAKAYYIAQKNAYDARQVIIYNFDDIPSSDEFDTKSYQINSLYLSKLIQNTCSLMREAFERNERWISILWTDIDSKHPEAVRLKWYDDSTLKFDGKFSTSLYPTPIDSIAGSGLKGAYNRLMLGYHINDSAISESSMSNSAKDACYIWTYLAYDDVTEGSASNTDRMGQPPADQSCGIAVYLGKKEATEATIDEAVDKLGKVFEKIHKKKDPAKKD